jgi:hypothetical protein
MPNSLTRRCLTLAVWAMWLAIPARHAIAADATIYTLEVSDVSAKVGEATTMVARLKLREGYRILHAYNNRVGQLSSFDNAVEFDRKAFPGADQDGVLVFNISLRPTKPGKHPINGVLRFGYMQGSEEMAMISVPVIASVVGEN